MKEPASDFWVVCLAGSAGGLQAYIDILQNLPPNTGMAFVFAPYRSLEQPELLPAARIGTGESTNLVVQTSWHYRASTTLFNFSLTCSATFSSCEMCPPLLRFRSSG